MELVSNQPQPKFEMRMHMAGTNRHSCLYRDDSLGVQMEIHTTKYKTGRFGKGEVIYYIDGDNREFKTKEEFMDALRERNSRK